MASNYLIYDGDCPFCSNFVRFARLRESVGSVELIDARDNGPEVQEARDQGYVIDEGMLLSLDGKTYYGADCLNALALLSSRSSIFNRLNYFLFSVPLVARIAYPILKFGRGLTLRALGVSRLGY